MGSTDDLHPIENLYRRAADPRVRALREQRAALVTAPTPLQPLDRLVARLAPTAAPARVWIKRDDLTGLALGGNKARKLEYLVAQARAERADVIVTVGAAQSNHARQSAAAAAAVGLDAVLVLRVPPGATAEYRTSGNVLLDRVFGARLVLVEETAADPHPEVAAADAEIARLRAQGRRPFLIPSGGSTPVGALGYVDVAAEIADAGIPVDAIVLATGSGGTQAGLVAGSVLLRREDPGAGFAPRIEGVAVAPGAAELAAGIRTIAAETVAGFGDAVAVPADDVQVDAAWVGPGYGVPTNAGLEAIALFARTEGILLDPVYTAKAAAALIDGIRSGRFAGESVVFVHTGGAPALFAHTATLTSAFDSTDAF